MRTLTILGLLCLYLLPAAGFATSITQSMTQAQQLLTKRLASGDTILTCKSTSEEPCPTNQSGRLFVQYYVLLALHHQISPEIQEKIIRTIQAERRTPAWLWGYNKSVIVDADDTTYALLTLLMLGEKIDTADLQQFYDSQHQAYRSFISHDSIGPSKSPSVRNNSGVHLDVNANIFYLFQQNNDLKLINYKFIATQQNKDGSWSGYLYPDKFFPTYLAMRALCNSGTHFPAIKHGIQFLISTQNANGSWGNPYDTALALNAMKACRANDRSVIDKGVAYLIKTQQEDGSWKSDKHIWAYTYMDQPLTIWYGQDQAGTLTTALALLALR